MSRINGDEGELDALATYLEAVQVFLRQHIHSNSLSADLLTKVVPLERNGSNFFSDFSRELSDEPIRVKLSNQSCALEALERVGARVSENSTRSAG